jgi:acetyl esterase/lipase
METLLMLGCLVAPSMTGQVVQDAVYATVKDGRKLTLDLYLPTATVSRPLVVWIHGGAWRSGNKSPCPGPTLVENGFAAACISYRLSGEAIFPAQIHDCKAAIRWLRANALRYGYDARRIGVWGSSAGGHLAAMLGTSGGVKKLEGKVGDRRGSSRVQAVVDFFGPTDLLRMDDHPGKMVHNAPDSPESRLIGGPIQENKEKAAQANPITYAGQGDPPFLIVHGDADPLVPWQQSQLLHDALRKAGVDSTLEIMPGEGHGFKSAVPNQKAIEFFRRHLRGGAIRTDVRD